MKIHPGALVVLAIGLAALLFPGRSGPCAAEYDYSEGFIGSLRWYQVKENESLLEIARWYDLGYNAIVDANPGTDPFLPTVGGSITIPAAWILPDVPVREGIVINLPELRLYFFARKDAATVMTFPLGIGSEGNETPLGTFTVMEKIVNPSWYVPASIRRERPELPEVVPPGPDNPMGSHELRLSLRSLLIHGTNRPWGIGRRSSHGCLRLYPEDITQLFPVVPRGTGVTIVNQPVKVAVRDRRVYIQVHRYGEGDYTQEAARMLGERGLAGEVDATKLKRALAEKSGMPVYIGRERAW